MTVAGQGTRRSGAVPARWIAAWYVAAVVAPVVFAAAPAAAQGTVVEEVVTIGPGDFYQEALYLSEPGSLWEGEFDSVSGQAFDVYIIQMTDLIGRTYPDGFFAPIAEWENVTHAAFAFDPPNRFTSYTLVVDNEDNAHPSDAVDHGAVTVRMARSAPLRSNPQAQAILGSLAGVCAAALLITAVGVAVYLKYRRPPPAEDEESLPPRIEIPVDVPKRPRGAWAAPDAHEPPPGEPTAEESSPEESK